MKNMLKANVVMLSVGEQQYPQDYLDKVIKEIDAEVAKMDCNLLGCYKIMNFGDAENVLEAIKEEKVDLFILKFVSWHITSNIMHVLKNFRGVPLLIWGIGGVTDSTGKLHAPAAGAGITGFIPVAKEFDFTYKIIMEEPNAKHEYEKVADYIHAVSCAKTIRAARIGLIGYADMGLYPLSYDKTALCKKIGIDIENYDGYIIADLMNAFPEEKVKETMDWIRSTTTSDTPLTDQALEKVTRLYLAMKDKADGRQLDAIAVKCVDGITKLGFNPCLAQSLLADKDLSVICECDAYGLVTSIILSTVTGNASAFVEHYEVFDNSVLVGVCGFIPRDFIDGDFKVKTANLGEYNTGISNVSKLKTGEVTYGRFFMDHGKYKLFLQHGTTKPNPKWTELGWAEPTPDFPAALLELEMPLNEYLDKVPGQHVIMVFGDHVEKVKTVCDILGVEVVE